MKLIKSGLSVPEHVADPAEFKPKEEVWGAKTMAMLDKAFAFIRDHNLRMVLVCETCVSNKAPNPQLIMMPVRTGGIMAMCACTKRLWKV